MKFYLAALVLSLFLISSCAKDDSKYPNVEEELHIYFDRFIEEANERGIAVDLSDINGYVAQVISPGVAGLCKYEDDGNNEIIVDEKYWDENDDLFREFVVFHELGHCKLLRDHIDQADNEGFCVSLMASGLGGCNDNYTAETREAYIDELFQ